MDGRIVGPVMEGGSDHDTNGFRFSTLALLVLFFTLIAVVLMPGRAHASRHLRAYV